MSFYFPNFSIDTIEKFKTHLKDQIENAIQLPFKNVCVAGKKPKLNDCHVNAQDFENENIGWSCTRGWLVVSGADSNIVYLLPHSVLKDELGQIYEITPINSLEPRPFLEADIKEEDFVELSGLLISSYGTDQLILGWCPKSPLQLAIAGRHRQREP